MTSAPAATRTRHLPHQARRIFLIGDLNFNHHTHETDRAVSRAAVHDLPRETSTSGTREYMAVPVIVALRTVPRTPIAAPTPRVRMANCFDLPPHAIPFSPAASALSRGRGRKIQPSSSAILTARPPRRAIRTAGSVTINQRRARGQLLPCQPGPCAPTTHPDVPPDDHGREAQARRLALRELPFPQSRASACHSVRTAVSPRRSRLPPGLHAAGAVSACQLA